MHVPKWLSGMGRLTLVVFRWAVGPLQAKNLLAAVRGYEVKAVKFDHDGNVGALQVVDVPGPFLERGEVLVAVKPPD